MEGWKFFQLSFRKDRKMIVKGKQSSRGRRVTLQGIHNRHEDLPFGILIAEIKKAVWGKNVTHNSYYKGIHPYIRQMKTTYLQWKYKDRNIGIRVKWDDKCERFAIKIECPSYGVEGFTDYNGNPKTSLSGYIEQATKKIELMVLACEDVIDATVQQIEEAEKRDEIREQYKKSLISDIDMNIKLSEGYTYRGSYEYGDRNYALRFQVVDIDKHIENKNEDDPQLFSIRDITGNYTMEEIQQIIKIVGGNPRAIAARLLK